VERELHVSEQRFRALADALDTQVQFRTQELRRRNEEVLRQSDQLRDLSGRLMRIQDEERRRIARELHDSVGQNLAALGMTLAGLEHDAKHDPARFSETIKDAQDLIQVLTKEIRTTSYLLHPPMLDEIGLLSALRWYIDGLVERSGLSIELNIPDNLERLAPEMELAIFRLVQECLTNIHRHSGSKTAVVRVAREPDKIHVQVQDYGKGISQERLAEIQSQGVGVGISGMRERVRQSEGELTVDSNGSGTKITAIFPAKISAAKEYGGPGWSITRRFIFEQETSGAGTLPPLAFSVTMVGPVIYTFGNAAQKERFLPRILSGEDWWCQGYSEPGSGSDLASVRTKAVRDGDHYIVNGHKTWTTLAQHADWIFCLVRTDPAAKPQSGISFLLIDMKSPGVTVRPIITIDGSHEVNDVFLEDVRVPAENLIGEENKGWTYAKFLLGNERTSMAGIGRSTRYLNRLKQIVKTEIAEDDPSFGEFIKDIARVELDVLALEATELRVVAQMSRGIDPGPAASLFKIRGTEIFQRITELTHQAIGNYGLAIREQPVSANRFMPGPDYGHTASEKYLNSRKLSIYGGSNEIQRNIIAKAVLGL
jgi:alkylation response protein AidB-like acyl-CoA dehydrogenase